MNAETLKGILVSGAVSAAVAFGVVHASVTPSAQVPAAEAQHAAVARAEPAVEVARPPLAAANADVSDMREAESDGGYQYWMEHQKAMP